MSSTRPGHVSRHGPKHVVKVRKRTGSDLDRLDPLHRIPTRSTTVFLCVRPLVGYPKPNTYGNSDPLQLANGWDWGFSGFQLAGNTCEKSPDVIRATGIKGITWYYCRSHDVK